MDNNEILGVPRKEYFRRENFHKFSVAFSVITSIIGIFCFAMFNLGWICYILVGIGIAVGIGDSKYHEFKRHQKNKENLTRLVDDVFMRLEWKYPSLNKQKEIVSELREVVYSSRGGGEITEDVVYAIDRLIESLSHYKEL